MKARIISLAVLALALSGAPAQASDGWNGPGLYLWLSYWSDKDQAPTTSIDSGPYANENDCFARSNSEAFMAQLKAKYGDASTSCGYFNTQADWDSWKNNGGM